MTALGDTVAQLVSGRRSAFTHERPTSLKAVDAFGDNPGALRMLVHAPRELTPGAPLVVVLHGCRQTAAGYAEDAGWLALADRYGFVVLCPEQTAANNPSLCFNWFNGSDVARGSGEAASIASMVERAAAIHGTDPRRVFVTGLSAGGAMTAAMLAAYPDLFAAGAIIAGLPYGAASGVQEALSAMRSVPRLSARAWGDKVRGAAPPSHSWPRVAIWHGDADATVAPGAADALVLQWTDVHGVALAEAADTASARHRHQLWRGANGEVLVESHRIAGLGHGAPIAAGGPDGCGSAAPWILEADVSSSLEIARFWGIARRRPTAVGASRVEHPRAQPSPERLAARRNDVGEVIARALKSAGLLR